MPARGGAQLVQDPRLSGLVRPEVLRLLRCSGAVPSRFHLSAWGVAVEVLAVVVVLVTVVLIVPAVHLLLCAVILVEQRRLGQHAAAPDSVPTRIARWSRGWIGRICGGVLERLVDRRCAKRAGKRMADGARCPVLRAC
ncbi:hypothetical protein [Rhodococcus koreensis]